MEKNSLVQSLYIEAFPTLFVEGTILIGSDDDKGVHSNHDLSDDISETLDVSDTLELSDIVEAPGAQPCTRSLNLVLTMMSTRLLPTVVHKMIKQSIGNNNQGS